MSDLPRVDPDDRHGTVGLDDGGAVQIRFRRRLRHAPDEVWAGLVDPARQTLWMPGCTFEALVGAPVLFDFGDEGRAEGEVLVVDPPRLLEHTWIWPGEPLSTVRYELEPAGGGTLLTLTQRPVGAAPAIDYCTGWHVMLDALGEHLAGRDPNAEPPDFERLYGEYASRAGG